MKLRSDLAYLNECELRLTILFVVRAKEDGQEPSVGCFPLVIDDTSFSVVVTMRQWARYNAFLPPELET